MFSKVSISPLNSFLWFTDDFFATRGFTSDVSWCLGVICSKIKDETTSFALILNYFCPYSSQVVATDGRKQFQYLNSLLRRACHCYFYWPGYYYPRIENKKSWADDLCFFLPSLPTTQRSLCGGERCLNIALNNKSRPLGFGIQSIF